MKSAIICAALMLAAPASAFAVAPFNQSSITMPDGTLLTKQCNQRDTPTSYRLDVFSMDHSHSTIDVDARPHCPATIALTQGKNIIHVVLGFSGRDRAATRLFVGDSNNDLVELKGMELQEGEARTAEAKGTQYRVIRLQTGKRRQ